MFIVEKQVQSLFQSKGGKNMTLNEVLGTPSCVPYKEKYYKIIQLFGFEEVKKCVPFTLEELKEAYKEDEYLNNLPMEKFDLAAGFKTKDQDVIFIGSQLTDLYKKYGVDTFSVVTGVCILKECAREWVKRELLKEKEWKDFISNDYLFDPISYRNVIFDLSQEKNINRNTLKNVARRILASRVMDFDYLVELNADEIIKKAKERRNI